MKIINKRDLKQPLYEELRKMSHEQLIKKIPAIGELLKTGCYIFYLIKKPVKTKGEFWGLRGISGDIRLCLEDNNYYIYSGFN